MTPNPAISTELAFFLRIIFAFIIGTLASNGYVDPGAKEQLVSALVETAGVIINLVTSFFLLYHVGKSALHWNDRQKIMNQQLKESLVKNPSEEVKVFTDQSPVSDSGTPPPEMTDTVQ